MRLKCLSVAARLLTLVRLFTFGPLVLVAFPLRQFMFSHVNVNDSQFPSGHTLCHIYRILLMLLFDVSNTGC